MNETRYAWSTDEETYWGDEPTRDDAIAAAHQDQEIEPGATIYTGAIVRYTGLEFMASASNITDDMEENAADQCGECSSQWLTPLSQVASDDLDRMLQAAMSAWLATYDLVPKFFTVKHVVEHYALAQTAAP